MENYVERLEGLVREYRQDVDSTLMIVQLHVAQHHEMDDELRANYQKRINDLSEKLKKIDSVLSAKGN
jgi:hypothetical protein